MSYLSVTDADIGLIDWVILILDMPTTDENAILIIVKDLISKISVGGRRRVTNHQFFYASGKRWAPNPLCISYFGRSRDEQGSNVATVVQCPFSLVDSFFLLMHAFHCLPHFYAVMQ